MLQERLPLCVKGIEKEPNFFYIFFYFKNAAETMHDLYIITWSQGR